MFGLIMLIEKETQLTHKKSDISQLFSSISVNSDRIFTDMRIMELSILKATIHQD